MQARILTGILAFAVAAVLADAGPAYAQAGSRVEAPQKQPRPARVDRSRDLDFLFNALKAAPDETSAKAIEERIWAVWNHSRSDTANLLMSRVKKAMDEKAYDLALKLLDSVVTIRPDYAEGWNRRATVHYLRKDYSRAIQDIRQVLAREPRHFGAITGLGLIMQEIGEEKRALEMFRRALAIHPRLPKIPDMIKALTEKVEGRDI
jgi:tetratricopeptide (TPR) repeat protein